MLKVGLIFIAVTEQFIVVNGALPIEHIDAEGPAAPAYGAE